MSGRKGKRSSSKDKGKRSSSKDKRSKTPKMVSGFIVTDYNEDDRTVPLAPSSLKKKTKRSKSKGGNRSMPLPGEGPSSSSSSMLSGPSTASTSSLLPPARIKVEPRSPQSGPSPMFPLPHSGKSGKSKGRGVAMPLPGEGPSSSSSSMLSGPSTASTSSLLPPARIKVKPGEGLTPWSEFILGGPLSSSFCLAGPGPDSLRRMRDERRSPQSGPSPLFPSRIKVEPRSPQDGPEPASLQRIKVERRSPQAESYSVPSETEEETGRKRKTRIILPRKRYSRAAKDLPPLHYCETRRRATVRSRPTTAIHAVRQLKEELLDAFSGATQSVAASRATQSVAASRATQSVAASRATQSVAASRARPSPLTTTVIRDPPSSSESSDCVLVSWESPVPSPVPKKGKKRRK